jgi:hypothetical protein
MAASTVSDPHARIAERDASESRRAVVRSAIAWAPRLLSPLAFVCVRRSPPSAIGEPYSRRRLDTETPGGRRAFAAARTVAEQAGVSASAEMLEGRPEEPPVELARLRSARVLMLGSQRRRLRRSIGRKAVRTADRPVLVAAA